MSSSTIHAASTWAKDLLASLFQRVTGLALSDDCDVCRKIETVYTSSERDFCFETLGSIKELLASNCGTHSPLIRYFAEKNHLDGPRNSTVVGISKDHWSTSVSLFTEDDCFKSSRCSELLEVMQKQGLTFGFGRRLDLEWIESQRLYKWYRRCKKSHGSRCSLPPYLDMLPAPEPQYFIDAVNTCLVAAKPGLPYVALSYVCDQDHWLKLTLENIDILQKPGGLVSGRQEDLPKTVYDVVNLLHMLGERYLWVAGLSALEHGRLSPTQQQLQKTSIFAHAELVIVAADGPNEDYGLRGIKELHEAVPRDLTQSIIPFGDREFLLRNFQVVCDTTVPVPKYFELGSTFEEYMYSRRRLIFHRNSIVLECRQSSHAEEIDKYRWTPPWDCHYAEFMHENGFPSLTVYLYLVKLINDREFILANDVLAAFAGTLSTLRAPMPGGFFHGLPEMFFDVALLWQPKGDVTLRPSGADPTSEGPVPPSWSWAAWAGQLEHQSWATGTDFSASSRGLIARSRSWTFPTTTWYASDGPAGGRRRIDVQWALWRDRYKDETVPLPPGWSRKKHVPGSNRAVRDEHVPDGYGKYLYNHTSNPFDYWFPVPLSDPSPSTNQFLDLPYLFGRVSKTTLRARLGDQEASRCLSLVSADGQWTGALRLHNLSDQPANGAELDVVAISRGSLPNQENTLWMDLDRFEEPLRPVQGERYEFYNVLWVKFVQGVAYRNGLGRVSKAAWDCQQLEEIELMLG